jgi:uncharacterized protein (TIGR02145 family)
MSENLNVSTFRNGEIIKEAKTKIAWKRAGKNGKPAWCNYDDYMAKGANKGKLYNWYAINDPRGLVPQGWHLPSDTEWTHLTDFLGGNQLAGKKMKSTNGWYRGGNGTNESGFNGVPGGIRGADCEFHNISLEGCWWSSTEASEKDVFVRYLGCIGDGVTKSYDIKQNGLSVRCIRD